MDKNYEARELPVVNLHWLFHPNEWTNSGFELAGLLTRNLVATLSKENMKAHGLQCPYFHYSKIKTTEIEILISV